MRCANCGIELVGAYCHGCGQHVAEANELALRPLARRFGADVDTLAGVIRDGRSHRVSIPPRLYVAPAGRALQASPFAAS